MPTTEQTDQMARNANNAIRELPLMSFRGLKAPPYTTAPSNGSHTQAQRDYPFVDAAGHEHIRRDPIEATFDLHFLNSLGEGLFPELFKEWTEAFVFDGSLGELLHPYWGRIKVRPMTWSVDMNASMTAGCVMSVSFKESIKDPAEELVAPTVVLAIRDAARKADEALEIAGIKYPTGERNDDLLGMVNQIESFVFSARMTVEGFKNQALGIINGLIEDVESLNDNIQWAVKDSLLELWASIYEIETKLDVERSRLIGGKVITVDTTMNKFAEEVDNKTGEIMALNLGLLGQPYMPAFSFVNYYTE